MGDRMTMEQRGKRSVKRERRIEERLTNGLIGKGKLGETEKRKIQKKME